MDLSSMLALLKGNQFLSGGLIMGLIGSLALALRSVPKKLYNIIQNRLFVQLEFTTKDSRTYSYFLDWLSTLDYAKKNKNISFSVDNSYDGIAALHVSEDTRRDDAVLKDSAKDKIMTGVFGYGSHTFKYKKRRFWLEIERVEMQGIQYDRATLKCYSINNKVLSEITEDIIGVRIKKLKNNLEVLFPSGAYDTHMANVKKKRGSSLFYNNNLYSNILSEIKLFMDDRPWYEEKDIPHTRGYLLYGPPDTGKTCMVKALASDLNLPIVAVNLKTVVESELKRTLTHRHTPYILLIEDIDNVFVKNNVAEEEAGEHYNRDGAFDLTSLLNLLDGITGSDVTRILFVTTNIKECLDSALLRPGRVDRHIELGYATDEQIQQLYKFLMPESPEQEISWFIRMLSRPISMAYVREEILKIRTVRKYGE